MTNAKDLIIQRKVSREVFMKFLYNKAVLNDSWESLYDDLLSFIEEMEEDSIEIHKFHGGRDFDTLEVYRDVVFDCAYLMEISDAIEKNKSEIDNYINKYARNWTIETLPIVDVAILRLAIAEIMFMFTVPNKVACDEAVNLAKKYCEDNAYKYINGILGNIISE